jgi:hypothetical protein
MPPLRTFVTFALVGPPLGWLIYAAGVMVGDARPGGSLSALVAGVPALLLGLPFSYAYGIIPALLVAAIMVLLAPPGPVHAGLVGLLCGIGFALFFHRTEDVNGLGVPAYVVLKILTWLVPSLICWWLVRRKRTDASETGQ